MSDVHGIDLVKLYEQMKECFNLDELDVLVFQLSIDKGNVPGPQLDNKTIQIIEYCKRRGPLLMDLIALCEKERPYLQWRSVIKSKPASIATTDERSKHRQELYAKSKNIQMVHTVQPSKQNKNYWDILVYLVRHQSTDLSIVKRAEFFLGRYWKNMIFEAPNQDDFVGIVISAYGPALCTCRVVFVDGNEVMLHRYLDLEMINYISPIKKDSDVVMTLSDPKVIDKYRLTKLISSEFNINELKITALELGINYEEMPSASKPSTVRRLVTYMDQHKKLDELVQYVQEQRPTARWQDVYIDS